MDMLSIEIICIHGQHNYIHMHAMIWHNYVQVMYKTIHAFFARWDKRQQGTTLNVWGIRRLDNYYENTQQWCNHLNKRKDDTIWSCTAYILARITDIPQQLCFEPGVINQWRCSRPGTRQLHFSMNGKQVKASQRYARATLWGLM